MQQIIDWILETVREHQVWGGPLAFAVAFSESFLGISFLIPATMMLLTLGALTQATDLGFWPVWGGAVAGCIVGDVLVYWAARHYHAHLLEMPGFRKYNQHVSKSVAFFKRWGLWAVFLGRFTGPFRATIPVVAGISNMAWTPFFAVTVISTILWGFALVGPGAALFGAWLP